MLFRSVPVGVALVITAIRRLDESHGSERGLDLPGLALASAGLFGLVFGLIRAQTIGWNAPEVLISLAAGVALIVAFVLVELRSKDPMLPMQFFARRSFAVTNVLSLSMYFGMFGSIFFMSQYLQNVLGNTPLQAGVKLLVWTGAIMLVSPAAGYFSERFGSRLLMTAGLGLQAIALAWLASLASVDQTYTSMLAPFVLGGAGMALVFAPSASAVLAAVRTDQAGQASGATNAIRELGGVLGIAVLSTVFTSHGSYVSPQDYVNGLTPAMWVGTAVLAAGALAGAAFPFDSRKRPEADEIAALEPSAGVVGVGA